MGGQITKTRRIVTFLHTIISTHNNKYMTMDAKSRIYKTVIPPIMTYTAKTKVDSSKKIKVIKERIIGKCKKKDCNGTSIEEQTKESLRQQKISHH